MYQILGLPVKEKTFDKTGMLPMYILGNYNIELASIADMDCIFITPIGDMGTVNTLKKHVRIIGEATELPVAIKSESISSYRRNVMLEQYVPFVSGTQVFLPFLGTYLQKKPDSKPLKIETFTASAQVALIKWLLSPKGKIRLADLMDGMGYTNMTMSRVAKQLAATECFEIEKDGMANILVSKYDAKTTFGMLSQYMTSPVLAFGYVSLPTDWELTVAGTEAVAERTMLNPDVVHTYATYGVDRSLLNDELVSAERQSCVEIWKYDPKLLVNDDGLADPISVALSLKDCSEERVEGAVEDMLEAVWR